MKTLFFIVMMLPVVVTAQAPTFFQQQNNHGLTAMTGGDMISADVNGDGFPDVFAIGLSSTHPTSVMEAILYLGNGDGTFTPAPVQPFVPLAGGSSLFIYENDFPKYLVIAGYEEENTRTIVYLNDGNGNFSLHQELNGLAQVAMDAGYLNPAEPNSMYLMMSGRMVSGGARVIYTYKLINGNFVEVATPSALSGTPTIDGSIVFFDYDLDGDMDIFLTGGGGGFLVSRLYRNNGNMNFSLVTGTNFPELGYTSVAVAPLECNNPYPWLIISGLSVSGDKVAKVFRNDNGNFFFAQSLPGVAAGATELADINGDGYLDLFIGGGSNGSNNNIARLFTNDGTGYFTQSYVFNPATASMWAVLVDINSDGKPNVIYTGGVPPTSIWNRVFINTTPWEYFVSATALPANGGDVSGGGAYAWGAEVTVSATPAEDFEFVHWLDESGNVVATNAVYEFTLQTDRDLTAVFQPTMSVGDDVLSGVALYPNPTSGVVHVSVPEGVEITHVFITDILGRQFPIQFANTQIDMRFLPAGMYFVTVVSYDSQITKKVVKK